MRKISLIAAVDRHNGLGKDNQLLCHLPADLKHFKTLTMNKPIIMGHKTYLAIGRPLPLRRNIILSRTRRTIAGVDVVSSLEEALDLVKDAEEVMIIGGAQIFQEALPYATTIYLTIIDHHFAADVFFPILDEKEWQREPIGFHHHDEKNPYDVYFHKIIKKVFDKF